MIEECTLISQKQASKHLLHEGSDLLELRGQPREPDGTKPPLVGGINRSR